MEKTKMSFKKVLEPEWIIKFSDSIKCILFAGLAKHFLAEHAKNERKSNPPQSSSLSLCLQHKSMICFKHFPARSGYIQTLIFPEFSFSSCRFYDRIHLFFFLLYVDGQSTMYSIYANLCLDRCLFMSHAANGNS